MLTVPNTKLRYRRSDKGGWEYSDDCGVTWYFTFRSESEIRAMWPNIEGSCPMDNELDFEIYGDTLDEPIPDDLREML
jgi:hypothetical protein